MAKCKACGGWFSSTAPDELCPTCKRALKRLNGYAVSMVRCKDCKHCNDVSAIPPIADSLKLACAKGVNWRATDPNHFCSYGERMKIPDDAVFSRGPDLIELIMKARKEAVARGIKADSVVINANMVYVPALFGERPEMICGLDVYVTKDELPDGYSFAVLHNANKETESSWIPVTERLPENRDDVLLCRKWWNEVRNPQMGWYNEVSGEWFDLSNRVLHNVTHWMPLPSPPKGE